MPAIHQITYLQNILAIRNIPVKYKKTPKFSTYETEEYLAAAPNFWKYFYEYDATDFYTDLGNMQAKYKLMVELLNRKNGRI